jgi:MFS family permease
MRQEIDAFSETGQITPLLTRRFALATAANVVFFVGITSFFALPVHLAALGANRAEIGRVMGSFGIASLVAIPLTGALVDRFGRRVFMIAGAAIWAALSLGFSFVERMGPAFYLLRLGQGFAFSLAFVATNALIVDLAPPGGLGRAIGLFGATTLFAHAVGPSVGEWVAHHWGFRRMFELSALVSLVAAVAFVFVNDVVRPKDEAHEKGAGWLALMVRPGARGALTAAFGSAITFGAAINFMPVFVRSRGLSSHTPFFMGYVTAAISVRLIASGLGDRIGHRLVGAVAALGFAATAAGFAGVTTRVELIGLALVFGLSHGVAYPAMNALFVEGVAPSARGRAMALFNLAFNIGITLAAFVAGEIAERFDYRAMWLAVAVCAAGASAAMFLDREKLSGEAGRVG